MPAQGGTQKFDMIVSALQQFCFIEAKIQSQRLETAFKLKYRSTRPLLGDRGSKKK